MAFSPFSAREFLQAWRDWTGPSRDLTKAFVSGRLSQHLTASRLGPFNIRSFPWVGYGDYLDFPFCGQPNMEIVALLEELKEDREWDLLVLPNLLDDSPTLANIRDMAPWYGLTCQVLEVGVAPYLRLEGNWQAFYGTRPRKFRQNLKWSEKRLAHFGRVEFIHCVGEESLDEWLNWAFRIYAGRWKGRYTSSTFLSSGREFYRLFAIYMARQGCLDLAFITIDGQPIAFCYALIYGGCYYYYVAAMDSDPRYVAFSPGTLLLKHLIECAFEKGLSRFDFMLGNEPYKYRWTETARSVFTLLVANPAAAKSRLALSLYIQVNRFRDKLRSSKTVRWLADRILSAPS